jgi:ABC-type Fe3+/spermidine/putrescine transport system ATPase subunit
LSNLDAKIRIAMRHEIRALQQRIGLTAIHVTHDQEEAMTMADRIVILDQGRIAQDGNPEAVYRRPNSPFVASFLGADNVIEATARYQGDKIELKLPGGVVAFLPAERALDGDVAIHFRSGAVRLGTAEEPGLVLHGRVTQASYPGGRFRYEVETASGKLFVDADRRAAAGDTVEISIPADELHVFARPKAGFPSPQGDL